MSQIIEPERPPIPGLVLHLLDDLALCLPAVETLLGVDHPPPDRSDAEAFGHYGEGRKEQWHLWRFWAHGTRLIFACDAWVAEVMPQPTGGRARTRD